jgi:hypothetical protein
MRNYGPSKYHTKNIGLDLGNYVEWHIAFGLQLKKYETSIISSIKQNLTTNFLLIYVFCTSCEHEIVLTILKMKTKIISPSQLVQNR